MMNILITFIFGGMIGFEILDDETCKAEEIAWGLILDLLFIRVYLWGDFQLPEGKPA